METQPVGAFFSTDHIKALGENSDSKAGDGREHTFFKEIKAAHEYCTSHWYRVRTNRTTWAYVVATR